MTAPRPRVEGERTNDAGLQALAVTTDAEAFELGPAGFALKAMALDLLDARKDNARLSAEVERLRGIATGFRDLVKRYDLAFVEAVNDAESHSAFWPGCTRASLHETGAALDAALALPTPAPEATE